MRTLTLLLVIISNPQLIFGLQNQIPERPSINFYSDEGELVYSSRITTSCENVPEWTTKYIASVENKACVILYNRINCAEDSSLRLTQEAGSANNPNFKNCVSFRSCHNISEKNPYRDYRVAVYKDAELQYPIIDTPISHECINFNYTGFRANNVKTDICINYFSGPDCAGEHRIIEAGVRLLSVGKTDHQTYKQSFIPCNIRDVFSSQFNRLTVEIFEFEIEQGNNELSRTKRQDVYSKEFPNMEGFAINQAYYFHDNLTNFMEIRRVIGNSQFNRFLTEDIGNNTFKMHSEDKNKIGESLTSAYNFRYDANQIISTNVSLSTIYPIWVNENVDVQSCSSCKLTTSVEYKRDQHFVYAARANITGVNIIGDNLRVEEIIEMLPATFKYIGNANNDTVVVEFRENIITSYFLDPKTTKVCSTIDNCRNDCEQIPGLFQVSAGTCGECDKLCKTCHGKFLEDCLDCNFAKEGNNCVNACGINKRNENGTCVECSEEPEPDCNLNPPKEKNIEDVEHGNGGYTFIFVGIGIAVVVVVIVAIMAVYIKRHGHLNASGTYNVTKATSADNTRPESKMLLEHPPPPPREIQTMKTQKVLESSVDMEPSETAEDERDDQLELIMEDIRVLETEVEKFEGPHFTKIYRTLQGDCTKLNMDLDKINVDGRENLRNERRKLFQKIEELADELAKKAHNDGKICELCEVKE